MNTTNLLIVGGCGSIGTALIESLNVEHVFVLDKQIKKNQKNITYIKCNLLDLILLEKVISKLPSNLMVIYLAGNLSSNFNSNTITESFNDNVIALSNFLNLAKLKLSHFIFVSTISVYGFPMKNPIDENHPIQPLSLYGCSKAAAEIMCSAICRNYEIQLTVLRLSQLYGLPSAKSAFPHVLLDAIKSHNFSRIKIDQQVERDYLHISDFVHFLKILIAYPKCGTFNVGFGKGVNLFNLVTSLSSFYKITVNEREILDNNSSFSLILDTSLIKEVFNFYPKQTIDLWLKNELKL